MGRIERSQKLKTDVGNVNVGVVRNFGSWEERDVVRLDKADAEDSSGWCVNGETAVAS